MISNEEMVEPGGLKWHFRMYKDRRDTRDVKG